MLRWLWGNQPDTNEDDDSKPSAIDYMVESHGRSVKRANDASESAISDLFSKMARLNGGEQNGDPALS